MSARSIGQRSFLVMMLFIVVLAVFSILGLAGGVVQLTSASNGGWSLGPLSCGCSVMSATATTMWIVPTSLIVLASLFLLWLGVSVVHVSRRVRREWQRRRAGKFPANDRLRGVATRLGVQRVFLSRTEPDASTIGFWRPEILVSERLVRGLPTGELMAVLAHEAAHQTQYDSARLFWVAVFEQAFGKMSAVKKLVAQFRQSIEHAADQACVAQLGGAFPLSRALTRLLGWRLSHADVSVASFAAAPDRLEALLRPTQHRGQFFLPQLFVALFIPLLGLALLMRPAGAAPPMQPAPGTMCHAPTICRLISNSSPATHQSQSHN